MNKGRRYLFAILCFTLIFSLAPVLPLAKQTQAATGLGLAESPWPMFQHNPQHTGKSPYSGPETPDVRWVFNDWLGRGDHSYAPVIGTDGTVYLATAGGLYAINTDGTLKWSYDEAPWIRGTPVIDSEGTVYVVTGRDIQAIDSTGTLKWQQHLDIVYFANPVVGNDGALYLIAGYEHSDGSVPLCLIRVELDGTVNCLYQIEEEAPAPHLISVSSPAVDSSGTIYFGYENMLHAINPNGTEKWVTDFGEGQWGKNIVSSPTISSTGTVYVSAGKFRAISADGQILWSSAIDVWALPQKQPAAIGPDGTIYTVGGRMGWPGVGYFYLYAFDAGGDMKWNVKVEPDWHFKRSSSPIVDADGIIYVGGNGGLRAFYPNGEQKWTGTSVFSVRNAVSLSLGQDGTLYVPGNSDLGVYALYAIGPEPAPSPIITQAWTSDSIRGPEVTKFPAGTEKVYVNYEYENLIGSIQKIIWYDNDGNVMGSHMHVSEHLSGIGTWGLSYPGEEFWPVGEYRAELFINNILLACVDWTVESPTLADEAAELAKAVVGAEYLWGGKGWDWEWPRFVESKEIKEGYHPFWYDVSTIYKGLDCSGLVFWSYNKAFGAIKYIDKAKLNGLVMFFNPISFEGADGQWRYNVDKMDKTTREKDLQPGDLLLFDPDGDGEMEHVAMYAGTFYQPPITVGGKEYEGIYNVVHATDSDYGKGIVPDTVSRCRDWANFVGFGRVKDPPIEVDAAIEAQSPVDLVVADPEGFVISKETPEIAGALYYVECDLDGDGQPDDLVIVPELKVGDYLINVTPHPDASPTDTYSLELWADGTTIVLANNVQVSDIPSQGYVVRSTETTITQVVPATIDFDPDTFNLKSKGKAVTVYIELPICYDLSQINVSTITLSDEVPALAKPTQVGDHDGDRVPDLMVKFDRAAVQETLATAGQVEVTISGEVAGIAFEGSDTIRVIGE